MNKKDEKFNIKAKNNNGALNKLRNIQILLEKESSLKSLCKQKINKYNNYVNNSFKKYN